MVTVAIVMFSIIAIFGIITEYMKDNNKVKAKMLNVELELEKVKQENFVVETEKMRLELEKMKLDYTKTEDPVLLAIQDKTKML
ncbi:hypothetical protein [Paenisporosarcina antarctica]|uniref:Uncharacterized protein n=1 Tax=Paenisporosarcina antarctica TaxID=417367 RepID=A0A4P7A117_9BACL|nr:hypothetical protein [Paenisporosarcina antarctica]QBP42353.1 hypothetical protein E2636_14850 [Paenisporosarcina antarctica]